MVYIVNDLSDHKCDFFLFLFSLDEKARINIHSTLGNNWVWRLKKGQITEELTKEIRRMTKLYGRTPGEE